MKHYSSILIALLLVSLFPSELLSQVSNVEVDISISGVEKIQNSSSDRSVLPYVETEVSIPLFSPDDNTYSVRGGLFLAGWYDRVTEPELCADCNTHSFRGAVVGFRSQIVFSEIPLPLGLIAGYSRHFIFARPVNDGNDFSASQSRFTRNVDFLELGVRIDTPIRKRTSIGVALHRNIGLFQSVNDPISGGYRLGVSTRFMIT